jgi:hypothetical protein
MAGLKIVRPPLFDYDPNKTEILLDFAGVAVCLSVFKFSSDSEKLSE